jgi:hypothetical protein
MPSLSEYSQTKSIKMLSIGDSGKGKTGALAALAEAGFKLRILDYDNGVGILASLLKSKPALANVIYEPCLDEYQTVGQKILPKGMPTAFSKGLNMLSKWKSKDGTDLGAVSSWGKDTILIIDSLSHMSNAALQYVLAINNRSGEHPWQSDWGQAMDMIEAMLKILYSDQIKCHVIVNAHITYIGEQRDKKTQEVLIPGKPYPNTLGQKLPPKIGQYFNTMLEFTTSASGKRIIRTQPSGDLGVKSEILGVPKELPLESGLADFFKLAGQLPK